MNRGPSYSMDVGYEAGCCDFRVSSSSINSSSIISSSAGQILQLVLKGSLINRRIRVLIINHRMVGK